MTTYKLQLSSGSKKYPTWVAEITGLDNKYGFSRKFIQNGNAGEFNLKDGLYNYKSGDQDAQHYIKIENSEVSELSKSEMLEIIK